MQVQSLGQEDPLEEGRATHSSIYAWKNPMDRGAWQVLVHRVSKSQTRLKQLSTHRGVGYGEWERDLRGRRYVYSYS